MVRIVLLLIVLVVVVLTVLALVAVARGRTLRHASWKVVEHARGDALEVWIARSRSQNLQLGAVPSDAIDFDAQLHELRSEARMRCAALNDQS